MNYERVLQKCVASVYPETAADCNSDFYVANGRGLSICCGDNIAIVIMTKGKKGLSPGAWACTSNYRMSDMLQKLVSIASRRI